MELAMPADMETMEVVERPFAVVLVDSDERMWLWSGFGSGIDMDAIEEAAMDAISSFEAEHPEVWIREADVFVHSEDEWYEYDRVDLLGEEDLQGMTVEDRVQAKRLEEKELESISGRRK